MAGGKQFGESKLLLHDAELADEAERLSAAAGAVVAAVRDLEAIDADVCHAATEHLTTYAHVVKALEGRPHHADLDALISAARADLAFPARSRTVAESGD